MEQTDNKEKTFRQEIRCFHGSKTNTPFFDLIPVHFKACLVNENPEYADIFAGEYARGIANGMKCKYRHPVAVVYELRDREMVRTDKIYR